jgi:hypothetical protein
MELNARLFYKTGLRTLQTYTGSTGRMLYNSRNKFYNSHISGSHAIVLHVLKVRGRNAGNFFKLGR